MNAFNRIVMLILALLLIGVPVFLLLVGLGVIPAEQVDAYTNYRAGLDSLGGAVGNPESARVAIGIAGAVVAVVALLLLLREIAFGRPAARRALVEEDPGRTTAVTARAVRSLVEGAAREVGAVSPTCYLASKKRRYNVSCNILVERAQNVTELATRVRENVQRVLEEQQVPFTRDVEVTVQGIAPQGE